MSRGLSLQAQLSPQSERGRARWRLLTETPTESISSSCERKRTRWQWLAPARSFSAVRDCEHSKASSGSQPERRAPAARSPAARARTSHAYLRHLHHHPGSRPPVPDLPHRAAASPSSSTMLLSSPRRCHHHHRLAAWPSPARRCCCRPAQHLGKGSWRLCPPGRRPPRQASTGTSPQREKAAKWRGRWLEIGQPLPLYSVECVLDCRYSRVYGSLHRIKKRGRQVTISSPRTLGNIMRSRRPPSVLKRRLVFIIIFQVNHHLNEYEL
jgi:hypothetical protein